MLIICPSCKTKFSFDDQKVGADGVKLRCSKCRTIFRVAREVSCTIYSSRRSRFGSRCLACCPNESGGCQ